jgi:hypothetical protein
VQSTFLTRLESPTSLNSSTHHGRPFALTVSVRKVPFVMMCSPEILSEQVPKHEAQHLRMLLFY